MPQLTPLNGGDQWVEFKITPYNNPSAWLTVTAAGDISNGTVLRLESRSPTDGSTYYPVRTIAATEFIMNSTGTAPVFRDSYQVPPNYTFRIGVPANKWIAGATIAVGLEA